MRAIVHFIRDERGASAAEYAIILAVIGSAVAVAAFALGESIGVAVQRHSDTLANCGGGC